MKSVFTQILAVFLIIIAVSLAIVWEFYLDDKLNTVVVLQSVKQLPRGHKVTSGDFMPLRIKINAVPEGAVKDITTIVSNEAAADISKGMIAVKDFFDEPGMVAGMDEMVAPIPNQWIYSLPGSLRRRDKVTIYEFAPVPQQVHYSAEKISNNQSPPKHINNGEPLLKNISVAFAKDSANQEVKPTNDNSQRIDATGNISQLELVLTKSQFELLKTKALKGYKFIFTYR